ncbi:hypothetical protein ENUP19_0041G0048 [Entamoeba nuttalli]|uniref:EGF-like domain-containing protein n=1 Tax=Entamoeba nuttalli TaxID=412467 RepID=A0ABQ0DA14_9EUKA
MFLLTYFFIIKYIVDFFNFVLCNSGIKGCNYGSWQDNAFCSYCYKCKRGCEACDEEYHCTKCNSGYWLRKYSSKVSLCEKCPTGCFECSSPTQCSSCSKGYYLDNGMCYQCPIGCSFCSGPNSCTTCERNYGVVVYGCSSWCSLCTTIRCSSCQVGTYLSNGLCSVDGECKECSAHCLRCSQDECLQCDTSTILQNGKCVENLDCLMTNEYGSCSKCVSTKVLNSETSSCESCPENFKECLSSTSCHECMNGYVLYNQTNCIKLANTKLRLKRLANSLIPHCEKETTVGCQRCDNRYYLTDILMCDSCTENCEQCNDSTTCQKCSSGYILNNSVCVKQGRKGCKVITQNGERCAICEDRSFYKLILFISYIILSCSSI